MYSIDQFANVFTLAIILYFCYVLIYFIVTVAACRPFLPPKNGYYVHDIQQIYYRPVNLLQIACKDGYDLISLRSHSSSGIAECQTDGTWNETFYCESTYVLATVCMLNLFIMG